MSNYLPIKMICDKYSVSRKTVYNWRQAGKVQFVEDKGMTLIYEPDVALLSPLRGEVNNTDITRYLHKEFARLHARINELEAIITQGNFSPEPDKSGVTSGKITRKPDGNYNHRRKQTVIDKGRAAFEQLGRPDNVTATALAKQAGVDRRTIAKYLDEIIQ
ncbi:hypothetical protein [Vibrio aerogenes]|uniref:hypothetical protein n=1 Tax=Vibrio aerogenes TaxID=92172 RepID=UPI0039EFD7B9